MQVMFAASAAFAVLALSNAARPGEAEAVTAPGSVRLVDQSTDLPASVTGFGGFAADDSDLPDPNLNPNPVPTPLEPDWNTNPGWDSDPGWLFQPSP